MHVVFNLSPLLLAEIILLIKMNVVLQCDDLIEKYGAGILILIEEVADPKVICTVSLLSISVCLLK